MISLKLPCPQDGSLRRLSQEALRARSTRVAITSAADGRDGTGDDAVTLLLRRSLILDEVGDFLGKAQVEKYAQPRSRQAQLAVCEFYRQDFACFGYSMPVACREALFPAQKSNRRGT